MLISYKRSQGSVIVRAKIRDSAQTDGRGKTGLVYNTSSLIISTIVDNEASATAYTAAGSTIETITTLGTFAAPTATKCRFKEVDSTNHKGVYEFQFADARYAVSSAKSLLVSVSGAAGVVETDFLIPLVDLDPYAALTAALIKDAIVTAFCDDTGTAQAGGGSTITLRSGAVATDSYYNGAVVKTISGTGAGQSRKIASYVGSTKVATMDSAWSVNPDSTTVYIVTGRIL